MATQPKPVLIYAFSAVALPVLVVIGNPAVALLVAATVAVLSQQAPVPMAGKLGKYALQTAIVLLGLRMNAENMLALSGDYALMIGCYVLLTLGLGLLLGRLFANESASSKLIAAGTAICGGTTIASLSPVINATPGQTGVALTLVVILNAVALFTFPFAGEYLGLSQAQFGVWVSMAIHDTSSVVATAAIYGEEAAEVATTLKLGRTLWLIPLLLVFALVEKAPQAKLRIPGFIFFFIGASIIGSTVPLPDLLPKAAGFVSAALLVVALYCIGAEVNRDIVRNLRGRVVAHGVTLWALVVPATLGLSLLIAPGA